MVLEEVSSDPDLYSAHDESPTSIVPQTDLSRLPSPMAFSATWGFTTERLQRGIAAERASVEAILGRPATPEEAYALAYHFAKGYRYASYGAPVGVAAGIYRASTTMNVMRWPLMPRAFSDWSRWNFDPETQTLSLSGRQLAKGAWLRPTLVGLKGSIYISFGFWVGGLLSSAYASSVTAVGVVRDPALKAFNDKILDSAKKKPGELFPTAGAKQQRVDPTGQGERTAGELWKDHRRAIGPKFDDASPTAGGDDFFNDEAERRSGNDSMLTDSQIQAQQRRQQPSPRRSPTENRAATFQMEKTERQPRSFADDFDMASSSSADDQSPTSGTSSGESAWDRIRRENASSGSSGSISRARRPQRREQQEQQQEGSTLGDSFTFSSSDRERAYARDEAQKDFDERVEQERRGGDFDSSGRRRKW